MNGFREALEKPEEPTDSRKGDGYGHTNLLHSVPIEL